MHSSPNGDRRRRFGRAAATMGTALVVLSLSTSSHCCVAFSTTPATTTSPTEALLPMPSSSARAPYSSIPIPIIARVPHSTTRRRFFSGTQRFMSTSPTNNNNNWSNVERSRPSRRDVFSYDLWVEHRSTDRFLGNLWSIFRSEIFRSLVPACLVTSAIATIVCASNALFITGVDDFAGLHHAPIHLSLGDTVAIPIPVLKLPAAFFNLCTPSLALLLIFKTNTSYRRWDEGRKNWGAVVNSSRTIMREAAAWIQEASIPNEDKQRLMERMELAVWCFCRSLTRHLLSAQEDQDDYARDCRERLRPDLAEDLIAARHKPTRALYELSAATNELPIDELRILAIDKSTTVLCDSMGSSERIFTSPVPRFYTRHTARFLEIWLLLVPFALYEPFERSWNHWAMIPATFIITGFLMGIDELGLQLEEPFSILPQHAITANSIGKVLTESVMWRRTDYERMMDSAKNSNGFGDSRNMP